MKFTDFKNELSNGKESSIYLLEGEDAYFRERGLSLLKDKFVTEPSLNFASFSGEDFDMEDFTASIFSFPFMSDKRMTLIREFYPKSDTVKGELKRFFEEPPKEDVLVIVNEKPVDILKKYSSVTVVDCSKADASILCRWVKAKLSEFNISVDFEKAKLLCEYCLSDMTRIENETLKLASYVGDGNEVKKEDIDDIICKDIEYKIYTMTDYIGKKKFDLAFSIIQDMLSKGESPRVIISSVYNYFRRLLFTAISGKNNSELASFFNIKEYAVGKLVEQASLFKKRSLKKAVDILTDADFNIKSGNKSEFEEMWLSVYRIMME